jgi:peroxiredoxin
MGLSSVFCRLALTWFALLLTLPLATAGQPGETPDIEAEMLDGTYYSLSDHKGEITLISVWSPESLSSRKCIGELQRFAASYASRGVHTLAASTLDDKTALSQFIVKRHLSLPVAILGKHDLGKLDDWKLPIVYVFDRDGKLRATHAGLFSMALLERMVEPLLTP